MTSDLKQMNTKRPHNNDGVGNKRSREYQRGNQRGQSRETGNRFEQAHKCGRVKPVMEWNKIAWLAILMGTRTHARR